METSRADPAQSVCAISEDGCVDSGGVMQRVLLLRLILRHRKADRPITGPQPRSPTRITAVPGSAV